MLSGDNGILQRATDAKTRSDEAQIKERIQLAELAARTDGKGELTYPELNSELTKEFGVKGTGYNISDESENPWKITVGNVEYDISHANTNAEVLPGESGYAGGSYNDPYIPVGFTHTGSETWNQGYTITGNDGSINSGDQFVWVPCSTAETLPEGVVRFQKTLPTTTADTDPNYKYNQFNLALHPFGGTNAEVNTENSSVNAIRTSVGIYGGFYIAKYEAGCPLDESNNEIVPANASTITDFSKKARSVSGANPWNYISRINAVTASSNMVTSSNVTSCLISGECWDTTLAWITATADSAYATNSEGKGWYSDVSSNTKHTTGYYGTNTKNIFDLGGNMWEWSTENCKLGSGQYAVQRGGLYRYTGSDYPAARRSYGYETNANGYGSFRIVLYK